MSYKFGTDSLKQYNTLHRDLQIILDWGIKYSRVDFSIIEGHRPVEKQFEYFKKGRTLNHINGNWEVTSPKAVITNVDGTNIKGKHNYNPSFAVDVTAYVKDKPELKWDSHHLTYIGATLIAAAEFLYEEGIITHKLRWGGDWDMDGDLADNKLYDRPHVELYIP